MALLIAGGAVIAAHAAEDAAARLGQAVDAACGDPSISLAQMADRIPGSTGVSDSPLMARGTEIGWERELTLPDGAGIRVERFAPGGRLRRLVAEYRAVDPDGGTRPRLAAIADESCTIRAGRRLLYEPDFPQSVAIEHLGGDLSTAAGREPLNPPVPPGTDPGGVAVALVDAGVNYLLDGIGRRLARDESGEILGHDYWDLDGRPFDANPARSPFFPQRHGTKTAGLLLREAPGVRLVPYRYPRPDMSRMTDLIRAADDAGIIVVNISMGSNERADWDAFAAPRDGTIFKPTFAYLVDTAWTLDALRRQAREMAAILAQCGIYIPEIDVRVLDGPDVYRYFNDVIGEALVRRLTLPTPTVYFVGDTLQVNAYDAEAIGKANSTTRPGLRYTAWFTGDTRDPGIALAHELSHILMDSGRHVESPGNLMRSETSATNTGLTTAQCQAMVAAGRGNGLLDPVSREQ